MSAGNGTLLTIEHRLQDANTAAQLNQLLGRLDEVLTLLDLVGGALKRGPEYADNINSLILQLRGLSGTGGLDDLAASLHRLEKLANSEQLQKIEDKITDEKTATAVLHLLDNLNEVADLLDLLLSALRRGPEYADNINGLLQKLREGLGQSSVSFSEQLRAIDLPGLRNTAVQLTAIIQSPQMQNLLASDIFGADSIELVDRVAKVAVEASIEARKPGPKIGIFSMLKMLGDPDIQRALRFAFGFAKKLGRELDRPENARAIHSKKPD